MEYKKCLVVNFWLGNRRYEYDSYKVDKLHLLKRQIKTLTDYKHNLNKIIFSFNIVPEHYKYLSEVYSIIPKQIQDAEIEINIRENVGISYGAWSDMFKKYNTNFDYYIFNEDDYFFVQNGWDDYLVNKHNSYDDCGYLCMFIREPQLWNNYRKMVGSSVGIASAETLNKIFDKYGKLPSISDKQENAYKNALEIQIEFGFAFIEVGLNIYDVRDDYSILFQKEGLNRPDIKNWLFFNWNKKFLNVCDHYFSGGYNYWVSFDLEFKEEYKPTTLEEVNYLRSNKLSYYREEENKWIKREIIK
jgi:hypothetical protein